MLATLPRKGQQGRLKVTWKKIVKKERKQIQWKSSVEAAQAAKNRAEWELLASALCAKEEEDGRIMLC